jgi:hypothetical protein
MITNRKNTEKTGASAAEIITILFLVAYVTALFIKVMFY